MLFVLPLTTFGVKGEIFSINGINDSLLHFLSHYFVVISGARDSNAYDKF